MEDTESSFKPDWRLWCIFGVIGLLNFAAALGHRRGLNGSAIEAFWAGTSFLVASTVFQPAFNMCSDLFGRKWTLFSAVVAFTVGAVMAAVAENLTVLLAGRCIQGIGGGGILALTEVLIADLIPLRERGKWMSIRALTWSLGTVLGPIIGGALAESAWRWIFWINLPFCGLGLLSIPVFLNLRHEIVSLKETLRAVDYLGCVLFTASLTAFLVPLSWGGVMYPWDSWHTLVPLIIGIAGLAGFVICEVTIPSRPLIPMQIFQTPTVALNYLACFLHGVILWCILYYLPLTLTVAPLSAGTAVVVSITGKYRWALWSGWAVSTLGLGLLYLLDAETSVPQWIFITLVPGIGLGILFSSMMLAVQASADPSFLSVTAAMAAFFRTLGQTVGVAIGGVVFQNRIHFEFMQRPRLASMADQWTQDAASLVKYIQSLPHGVLRSDMESAYADALDIVWLMLCGTAGLGLVSCLFVKGYPMDQAFKPTQGIESGGVEEKADV
ncbi:major facilitator superfamily domain-containing protein [Aspergillus californicus]